jgi:hypothetical protein
MKYEKQRRVRRWESAIGCIVLGVLVGCGAMFLGSTQEMQISSMPKRATVYVDGHNKGKTPILLELGRRQNHVIKVKLEGFKTATVKVERYFNGILILDIFLWGIIGLAVDIGTGAMYSLEPEEIRVRFKRAGDDSGDWGDEDSEPKKKSKGGESDDDEDLWSSQRDRSPDDVQLLYIELVRRPEPGWKKIGQLEPEAALPGGDAL